MKIAGSEIRGLWGSKKAGNTRKVTTILYVNRTCKHIKLPMDDFQKTSALVTWPHSLEDLFEA